MTIRMKPWLAGLTVVMLALAGCAQQEEVVHADEPAPDPEPEAIAVPDQPGANITLYENSSED